jgi:glucose-6-phosphate dehydrogenase assembly protein OpcA
MNTPQSEVAPGTEVPFNKIAEAMARSVCQDNVASPMRALVATVVAVGPAERLGAAAAALQILGDAGTVRGILISEGNNPAPPARVAGNTVALHGLKSAYVNNAVGALRLSSLPTVVWWRGGRPDTLDSVAGLAERVILDDEDPEHVWERAVRLFDDTAFSDLRWARLTQCRALVAHCFDIPEVLAAASKFTRLHLRANDRVSAALFAAWLTSTMRFGKGFTVEITAGDLDVPLQEIRLSGAEQQELVLRLSEGRAALETSVTVPGHRAVSRLVPLQDHSISSTLTAELRIRARDMAFERTVRTLLADRSRALLR